MRLTVAAVWTGSKYEPAYVQRLFNMVHRHLPEHEKVCLTDHRQSELPLGVRRVDVTPDKLPGWWAKMRLYDPVWRTDQRVIYLDLDTVIVGDISPLSTMTDPLSICGSFTRAAGHPTWPCRYGSCAQVINPSLDDMIWRRFSAKRAEIMARCGGFGDQMAVEELYPSATILQGVMPRGFFLDRRGLMANRIIQPAETRVVVFGGQVRPHNCGVKWAQDAWR